MGMFKDLTDSILEFFKTKIAPQRMKTINISIVKYGDTDDGIFIDIDATNTKEGL